MANIKSSKKDIKRSARRAAANTRVKSALKTYVKKTKVAILTGEASVVTPALTTAVKNLDKAVQRGIIHPNQAARRKSRIAKAANAAIKAGPVAAPVAEVKVKKAAVKGTPKKKG
jgi:small subunit ribosomal protein S20